MAKHREAQVVKYDPTLPERLREEGQALQDSILDSEASLARSYLHVADELSNGSIVVLAPPTKALVRKNHKNKREKVSYIEVSSIGDDVARTEPWQFVSEFEAVSAEQLPDFFAVVFKGQPDGDIHHRAALDALKTKRNVVFEAFPAMRPETA